MINDPTIDPYTSIVQNHYPTCIISDVTVTGNYLMANWCNQGFRGNILWEWEANQWSVLAEAGSDLSLSSLMFSGVTEGEAIALLEQFNPDVLLTQEVRL